MEIDIPRDHLRSASSSLGLTTQLDSPGRDSTHVDQPPPPESILQPKHPIRASPEGSRISGV